MPVVRKFLAQTSSDDCQVIKMTSSTRFLVNREDAWQFLFANSATWTKGQIEIKIACEYDANTMSDLRLCTYLYDSSKGSISSGAVAVFKLYRVTGPQWKDEFVKQYEGVIMTSGYFYIEIPSSDLSGLELDGSVTFMIEASILRKADIYRDRIYINHLGIWGKTVQLMQEVEFLDLTKQDL